MLNGSSGYGNSGASITADLTEPWLVRACAGLASRWAWHGGR